MDAPIDTQARELVLSRTFNAPRALVFKVWTQPEHMARWWGCDHTVKNKITNDLRVGGAFRSEMTLDDGTLHVVIGKYVEIDEPARLSFTWDWENGGLGSETLVEIDFEEQDGKTVMTFHHSIFETTDLCDAHFDGWTRSFERLADRLANIA